MKKEIWKSAVLVLLLLGTVVTIKHGFGGSGRPVVTEKPEAMTLSQAVDAAADGNWGLSFQSEGQPPVANATAEYLRQFNSWYTGTGQDIEDKCIYLTFDAGYENGCTGKILDVLKEEQVPAAFFLVGNYIEENPDLVKRMEAEGHLVGNHTMHHPDMSEIAAREDFEEELRGLESLYQSVTGQPMKKFYRPPQGKYSEENLKMAQELGYQTIFWSLAYVDWYENDQPSREEALNLLNQRIHPGAIVLLHSTSKTNEQIMRELIQGWKEKGYVFRSLTELAAAEEENPAGLPEEKEPAAS